VLDEATSQVSQDMETTLYQTCQRLHISVLSIGHRDSIRQFHQSVLHISGDGAWSLRPLDRVDSQNSLGSGDGGVGSLGVGGGDGVGDSGDNGLNNAP
jgi:hypothetical protein